MPPFSTTRHIIKDNQTANMSLTGPSVLSDMGNDVMLKPCTYIYYTHTVIHSMNTRPAGYRGTTTTRNKSSCI